MYEIGEKFYYYGDNESLHGNIGKVIRRMRQIGRLKEYECKIEGALHYKYLSARKMEKIHREPDWEI